MELRDDRIVLRPWRDDDAPRVFALCQDPEIQRWMPTLPRPYTEEHARAFVGDELGLGPHQFAVVEDGRVIGSIGLHPAKRGTARVGYWCAAEARGRGIATRALRRVCRFALEELGVERLELTTDVDNLASQRVAEKAGFQRAAPQRRRAPARYRDNRWMCCPTTVTVSVSACEVPAFCTPTSIFDGKAFSR